jgi:transcription antitermination factor NusG
MNVGDKVKILAGPFAGLDGSVARVLAERAIVLVELSGHPVPVEIDIDWLSKSRRRKIVASEERLDPRRRRRPVP